MTDQLPNSPASSVFGGTPVPWPAMPRAPSPAPPKESGPIANIAPDETKAGVAPTGNSSAQIPRRGVLTIAVVTAKGSSMGSQWSSVTLPKDAQVMDVVEVYAAPESTGAVMVFPNKGEAIGGNEKSTGDNYSGVAADVRAGQGVTFRKISTSLWLS